MREEDKEISNNTKKDVESTSSLRVKYFKNIKYCLTYGFIILLIFLFVICFFINRKFQIKTVYYSNIGIVHIYDRAYNIEISPVGNMLYSRSKPVVNRIYTTNDSACSGDNLFFIQSPNTYLDNEIIEIHNFSFNCPQNKKINNNTYIKNIIEIENKTINQNTNLFIGTNNNEEIILLNNDLKNKDNIYFFNYNTLQEKIINLSSNNIISNNRYFFDEKNNFYIINYENNIINKINPDNYSISTINIKSNNKGGSIIIVYNKKDNKRMYYLLGGENSNKIYNIDFNKKELLEIGKMPIPDKKPYCRIASNDFTKYLVNLKKDKTNYLFLFNTNKLSFNEIQIPKTLKNLDIMEIEFPIIIFEKNNTKYITLIKENKIKIIADIEMINNGTIISLDRNYINLKSFPINLLLFGGKKDNDLVSTIVKINIRRK